MRTHRYPEGSAPIPGRGPSGVLPALLAGVALALGASACGEADGQARSPCPRAIADAVARQADGAETHVETVDEAPDVVTCAYRAGAPGSRVAMRVTVDAAPQAAWRFSRAVVERAQAHLGGDPRQKPVQVAGVGEGASWAAAPHELTATAGRRMVTVIVLERPGARGDEGDLRAALPVARAALG